MNNWTKLEMINFLFQTLSEICRRNGYSDLINEDAVKDFDKWLRLEDLRESEREGALQSIRERVYDL